MSKFFLLTVVVSISVLAFGQSDAATEEYQRRIRKEKIGNRYIPADLKEAMLVLEDLTSDESREQYISKDEDFVVSRLYFSFGRWIANSWGFYDGSRFSVYLRNLGVDHPDGQIEFVMRAFHRHLRGEDLNIRDLVTRYKVKKQTQDSLKRANATVIDSYTRPVPQAKKDSLDRG